MDPEQPTEVHDSFVKTDAKSTFRLLGTDRDSKNYREIVADLGLWRFPDFHRDRMEACLEDVRGAVEEGGAAAK